SAASDVYKRQVAGAVSGAAVGAPVGGAAVGTAAEGPVQAVRTTSAKSRLPEMFHIRLPFVR
ncbi:MAG: hypothetical protein J7457_09130, partial [Roseiflexus sp.]|nr:hypothetical protein [Roseiflexus sp.]